MKFKKEIVLIIIAPILFVLLFEFLLRLFNFTYYPLDSGFNITDEYKIFKLSGSYYITNPANRYFVQNQKFSINKSTNEFRIFVLGGSSVFNLANLDHLTANLTKISGNKKIKVVNFGGISYGTTRLLVAIQEVLDYKPDLIIIYSGHNEFEERFLAETFLKETFFSRLSDKLIQFSRFYQFSSKLTNKATGFFIQKAAKLRMPPFPAKTNLSFNYRNEIEKLLVYKTYESNLIKMIKLARNNGVNIIISTVAYNRIPEEDYLEQESYKRCQTLYNDAKFENASACLDNFLESIAPHHRATKTINNIVKNISKQYDVPLADVDGAVVKAAEHSIPGFDLFLDGCHLNPKGNIILQDTFYATIVHNHLLD